MWVLQPAKSPKLVIFGINLPKRGIPPYAIFIKFWLGRESHVRTSMPNFIVLSFKKCGPTASKIAKNRIFGINLPLTKGKFTESTENVEYRCTVTNLPLCNDTINVLKITLLHSVSVITNFVIPKRDKKQTKKHHTFSSSAGARPTIPSILGLVIEAVRIIFASPIFLIRSVVSPLGAIENLWENAPTAGKCLWLSWLSPKSGQFKKLKST